MEYLLVSHPAYKEQDQPAAKQCIGQLKGRRSKQQQAAARSASALSGGTRSLKHTWKKRDKDLIRDDVWAHHCIVRSYLSSPHDRLICKRLIFRTKSDSPLQNYNFFWLTVGLNLQSLDFFPNQNSPYIDVPRPYVFLMSCNYCMHRSIGLQIKLQLQ